MIIRVRGDAPEWAAPLVEEVLFNEGWSYDEVKAVALVWHPKFRTNRFGNRVQEIETTAHASYYFKTITMKIGSEPIQHRTVLLHEIAHLIFDRRNKLAGRVVKKHHTKDYWHVAFSLFERYGPDMKQVLARELHLGHMYAYNVAVERGHITKERKENAQEKVAVHRESKAVRARVRRMNRHRSIWDRYS